MKVRIKFREKPYPIAPNGNGMHEVEGDLQGEWLWVTCPVTAETPAGKFAVHAVSRALIVPLEAATKVEPNGKQAAKGAA
jgi:hypothetical protein